MIYSLYCNVVIYCDNKLLKKKKCIHNQNI